MNKNATKNTKPRHIGLRHQVLLAALECSGGDLDKTFTAEDLLLAAWKRDPLAWGLRGHEKEHPDSETIYKELDRVTVGGRNLRGGLVALGLFEKVRQRTFRLTPTGLAEASLVAGAEPSMRAKAERKLADAVSTILSHPVFREWIKDPTTPKHFRDAGHFWGIAPGTPSSVIRARIFNVDNTLATARSLLESYQAQEIMARHGKVLFDRSDIERATEFQATLKQRFTRDLGTLQVNLDRGGMKKEGPIAVAKEATILERCDNGNPAKIKVIDKADGTIIYTVRYDKPMKRPANGVQLVYDDFHPELIRLETDGGAVKLRQSGKGLPDSCVILINLGASRALRGSSQAYPIGPVGVKAFGEADYEYYPCEAQANL